MKKGHPLSAASPSNPRRAVVCIIFAVAAFLLKRRYQGPGSVLVHSYLGNLSISFAVYFLAAIASARLGQGRFLSALSALVAVEAFELSDGFGLMSNVYDPWDLLANAAGVSLALGLDVVIGKLTRDGARHPGAEPGTKGE